MPVDPRVLNYYVHGKIITTVEGHYTSYSNRFNKRTVYRACLSMLLIEQWGRIVSFLHF